MNNSFTRRTKKGCPLSSLEHAVKRKRKMTLGHRFPFTKLGPLT